MTLVNHLFKLRFNTNYPDKSSYAWRVIEVNGNEWTEILTRHVCINTFSNTTTDILPNGNIKHHITINAKDVIFFHKYPDEGYEKITFI